jgi:2-hydroxymuconate-semialdehyde hydrolase
MRWLIKTCTKEIPEAELRRIEIPTSLIWGSHDRFVPLALGERASARLGWPLRVIDNAGHVPHIELTTAFLDALPAEVATESREEVRR